MITYRKLKKICRNQKDCINCIFACTTKYEIFCFHLGKIDSAKYELAYDMKQLKNDLKSLTKKEKKEIKNYAKKRRNKSW